eukprot:751727-Hanusia_phi.AAC.4
MDAIADSEEDSSSLWTIAVKTFKWTERWMVEFLRHNGFWGVLLFSSYPNALFDMCGLCCGHSMMPMWEFLLATTIGKGFVKAPLQELLFVWIFSHTGRDELLYVVEKVFHIVRWFVGLPIAAVFFYLSMQTRKMPKMMLIPLVAFVLGVLFVVITIASEFQEHFNVTQKMEEGFDKVLAFCDKSKPQAESKGMSSYFTAKSMFNYFVTGLILYFITDVINNLARAHATEEVSLAFRCRLAQSCSATSPLPAPLLASMLGSAAHSYSRCSPRHPSRQGRDPQVSCTWREVSREEGGVTEERCGGQDQEQGLCDLRRL